jgi:hypothetical protein
MDALGGMLKFAHRHKGRAIDEVKALENARNLFNPNSRQESGVYEIFRLQDF